MPAIPTIVFTAVMPTCIPIENESADDAEAVLPRPEPRSERAPARDAERVAPWQQVAQANETAEEALPPVQLDVEARERKYLRTLDRAVDAPRDEREDRR